MEKAAKQAIKGAFKRAVFIFRRDHRLDDNTGLLWALKNSEVVYPVFVFDNKQITPDKNKFYGSNCVQFMCESLEDLEKQLQGKGSHLNVLRGDYPDILVKIIDKVKPDVVCLNMDYTPYAKERDTIIEQTCKSHKVEFKSFEDITLVTTDAAKACYSGEDSFFKKFTPYYNRAVQLTVRVPEACKQTNFAPESIQLEPQNLVTDFGKQFYKFNPTLITHGGRKSGLTELGRLGRLKDYNRMRDNPAKPTSLLSPHNKFGTVSVREVQKAATEQLGKQDAEDFIRQLYWRDYYYFLGYFMPQMYTNPLDHKFSYVPWEDDPAKLEAWQDGATGSPLVDAAMRQLKATGWLSNRMRLITSNYLIKDLHINWQIGERYFASQLVDFDPAQNNGGWQWSAGCGYSTQPYFRIYDPKVHIEKFDPYGTYIKKWIPELEKVPMKSIINWESDWTMYPESKYPGPVVRHEVAKKRIMEMYQISLNTKPQKKGGKGGGYPENNKGEKKPEFKQDNRVKIMAPKYDDEDDDEPLYVPKNAPKSEALEKRPSTSAYPKEPQEGNPDEKYRKSYSNAKNEKISWKVKPQDTNK